MNPVDDLLTYLAAGTSPYHAVAHTAEHLAAAGFDTLDLVDAWSADTRRGLVRRGGALVAWDIPDDAEPHRALRIIGAHTDSPGLHIKPRPDQASAGWRQLGVEVYGGPLLNSWLDRDLGLSGRVAARAAEGITEHLVRVDRPLLRIPQLAVHLDREVNSQGLKLNPQQHLTPVWGVGDASGGTLAEFLADELDLDPDAILAWDIQLHDLTPPALLGRDAELLASARLDNLVSCWAAVEALLSVDPAPTGSRPISIVCLFDHEEVGSASATGAGGALLTQVVERLVLARGGGREDVLRALAASTCASADMAHATHPNYPERHDPAHHVRIDGGPVVKVNANQRYATDAGSAAAMIRACEAAGVPHQVFVSRNDQPCGSTIGPLTASQLGIDTVDVGVAQLSMHSARELCAAQDPQRLAAALGSFLLA